MPGASATGKFAPTPISSVARAAAAAVAATAGSNGTPAAARIDGLANRMYAIVRNVAIPPRTSRAGVVPRPCRSKLTLSRGRSPGGSHLRKRVDPIEYGHETSSRLDVRHDEAAAVGRRRACRQFSSASFHRAGRARPGHALRVLRIFLRQDFDRDLA